MNNNFILFVLFFLCSSFTKEHFTAFPTVTFKCHLKTETPTKLNSLVALISVASPPFLGCGWLCIWSALAPITREAWSAGVGEACWREAWGADGSLGLSGVGVGGRQVLNTWRNSVPLPKIRSKGYRINSDWIEIMTLRVCV